MNGLSFYSAGCHLIQWQRVRGESYSPVTPILTYRKTF